MKSRVIQDEPQEPRPEPPARPDRRQEASMSSVRVFVRAHPLVCFFGLAYLLSWWAIPWDSFFAPGALIAALVVAFVRDGLEGLKQIGLRLIRWRVAWYWYAIAIAVPLAVNYATVGLTIAGGAPTPDIDQLATFYGIPLAIGLMIVDPTGGPFSEEPSFRGFALPIMQNRHSPLVSAAVFGVLITVWHGPLFFLASFDLNPLEALTTVAVTFWYVWLFDHAGGSALITLIAHASEGGSVNVDGLWPAGADADREVWVNLALWAGVVAVLLALSWRFWVSRAPADARERRPVESRDPAPVG
jgi:uncharacterized protein